MREYEIIHFKGADLEIYSNFRRIFFKNKSKVSKLNMPLTFMDIVSMNIRILKRMLRTDKCNVYVLNEIENEYLIIRQGIVFHYNGIELKKIFNLKNCRNLLHVDIARTPNGTLYFGEYGANNNRGTVPIYRSKDNGKTWDIVYLFGENTIKHIHCVKYDPFSNKVWVFTGDKDGECKIMIAEEDFSSHRFIGDGTQKFRSCNVFFLEDKVVWMMDSPNEISYCVHFDRANESISLNFAFNGPVWYSHELNNGKFVCATSVEPGYSMQNKTAQVLLSDDLLNWKVAVEFKKDFWPVRLFKNGVVAFPIGMQDENKVLMFGEALNKFDGVVKEFDLKM